jgi:hypothetical protein
MYLIKFFIIDDLKLFNYNNLLCLFLIYSSLSMVVKFLYPMNGYIIVKTKFFNFFYFIN